MRRNVHLQDLPGLVYQLLVLGSKDFCKKEVIEGIVMYFGEVKSGGSIMRFARVKRLTESYIGVLKTSLFAAYKDLKFSRGCEWLSCDLKEHYLRTYRDMENAVLRAELKK
ncbi:hypothetical protein P3S67_005073 [Capsicum chacoense]